MEEQKQNKLTVKSFFQQDNVRAKFDELMGKRSASFMTSVLQIASTSLPANVDPMSVYNAACVAATLDLPINNSLGFAYIISYNQKQPDGTHKPVAQFQLGYRGLIQLAQRSGQFKTISATPIYEGQIADNNPLTGIIFDFKAKKSDTALGYAAYFELLNGFQKTFYMTIEDLKKHGAKYSKTFKNQYGLWNTDFDAMATKTVLKLLLAKYAPLSIEMQRAVITDQAVINDEQGEDVTYVDNTDVEIDREAERVILMISEADSLEQLDKLGGAIDMTSEQMDLFTAKKEELKTKKTKK